MSCTLHDARIGRSELFENVGKRLVSPDNGPDRESTRKGLVQHFETQERSRRMH